MLRARAAADVAGDDVDAFLTELGVRDPVDAAPREQITDALRSHAAAKARYDRLAAAWDDVFWGADTSDVDGRTRLEQERREAGGAWVSPPRKRSSS